MTIETLCKKYPALEVPRCYVQAIHRLIMECYYGSGVVLGKETYYKDFKANISCIGLEPSEYEFCIRWFCEVMEY